MMRSMLTSGAIGMGRHCNYVFRSDYRGVWTVRGIGGPTRKWAAAPSALLDQRHRLFSLAVEHRDNRSLLHAQHSHR